MKFSQEERDELEITLNGYGWPIILRLVEQLCEDQDKQVLGYNLSNGPDELVILKARTEGARKLQLEIKKFKDRFTKQGE
jgi:DNA-directed RNA polymerase subunit L